MGSINLTKASSPLTMSAYTAKFERTIGTAERSLTPALLHAVLTSLTLIQICGLRAIRRSVITYSGKSQIHQKSE